MHPALRITRHRPWPLPARRWRWRQRWHELAFLHYRVRSEAIRPLVPAGLKVQEFEGTAWVGVVPFRMRDVRRGEFASPPTLREFPELNLRTYVESERDGKPGVWFFSLDAASATIVFGGRFLVGLPYFRADMRMTQANGGFEFESRRRRGGVRFVGEYRPVGAEYYAAPGTFAHWATERYCLYAVRRGRLTRLEVHHAPWPLQPAEAEVRTNELLAAAGLEALDDAFVAHYSRGVDVVSYAAVPVEDER